MTQPADVLDLIRRARSGEESASAELARRIEPFIQRVVRTRMGTRGRRGSIEREIGSSDVCQSVFRSLFHGLRTNRYRLDQPGDLERLLTVMIRFNVATTARRSSVKLRELIENFEEGGWIDAGPRPDQAVVERDLIDAVQSKFSGDELELLTLWLDDTPWSVIGDKLGCTADAARVRLKRAVNRVQDKMSEPDRTDR
jgi:DNA-directed RNA polymerase specialized sigma24 family protein